MTPCMFNPSRFFAHDNIKKMDGALPRGCCDPVSSSRAWLAACLPACLPARPPACLPACLPAAAAPQVHTRQAQPIAEKLPDLANSQLVPPGCRRRLRDLSHDSTGWTKQRRKQLAASLAPHRPPASPPACLPACLLVCLPACLPVCLPEENARLQKRVEAFRRVSPNGSWRALS